MWRHALRAMRTGGHLTDDLTRWVRRYNDDRARRSLGLVRSTAALYQWCQSEPGPIVPRFKVLTVPGTWSKAMIEISPRIQIPESELSERFIRSPGPGGQNVNKLATAVQLRFDVAGSSSLPEDVRSRLIRLAGRRLDGAGVLTIEAHRFRTRERNREDARERLADLICRAAHRPKPRVATKPTRGSQRRRLESKRAHSSTKRLRASRPSADD